MPLYLKFNYLCLYTTLLVVSLLPSNEHIICLVVSKLRGGRGRRICDVITTTSIYALTWMLCRDGVVKWGSGSDRYRPLAGQLHHTGSERASEWGTSAITVLVSVWLVWQFAFYQQLSTLTHCTISTWLQVGRPYIVCPLICCTWDRNQRNCRPSITFNAMFACAIQFWNFCYFTCFKLLKVIPIWFKRTCW